MLGYPNTCVWKSIRTSNTQLQQNFITSIVCPLLGLDCTSLRSNRFRGVSTQISMFWPRENWGESKKRRGGRERGENPNRANQRLRSWANGSFQNRGVCPQAIPSPLLPSLPTTIFFLRSSYSRAAEKRVLSSPAVWKPRLNTRTRFWNIA